jgi:hypothetical protein
MEYLFDLDKPHFATWLELHNIDIDVQPAQGLITPLLSCCLLAIQRFSPILRRTVWVPRSCRTPGHQASAGCEAPTVAGMGHRWSQHWQEDISE